MIPLDLRNGTVMLAAQSKTLGSTPGEVVEQLTDAGGWSFEPKWDGVRCLLLVEDGNATLVGRSGRDETVRYPELVGAFASLPSGTVLDGELLVFRDGTPVFNLMQRRNSQSNPARIADLAVTLPATFMAFDCLVINGVDLRPRALETRRVVLDRIVRAGPSQLVQSPFVTDGRALWKTALEQNLEGLIAKPLGSPYRSKNRGIWVKIKAVKRLTAIISGYDPGEGKRTGMVGALKLSLLRGSELVEVGECGTGFTDIEARELRQMIDDYRALAEAAIAAGEAPPEPILGEIEYQECTTDFRLRFPSWKGLRHDIKWSDCTTAQIGA
jgi:bifunctional non-homologous end joining protein LigD